jgi:hypothetical protein
MQKDRRRTIDAKRSMQEDETMPGALAARSSAPEIVGEQTEVGLRERKKARLRQQIIDTSIKLFRNADTITPASTISCRVLEISQPTFFRYFPSKDAVLREVGNAVTPVSATGCVRSFRARRQPANACDAST